MLPPLRRRPEFEKFPVIFPVSREFAAQTGSRPTATSASQSGLGSAFGGMGMPLEKAFSLHGAPFHKAFLVKIILRQELAKRPS